MNEKEAEFQRNFDDFTETFTEYTIEDLLIFALARVLRVTDRENPRSSALASVIEDKTLAKIVGGGQ